MTSKVRDGNGNVRRHSKWTTNYRLFADCYTFWLPICVCCFSFYHGKLFTTEKPYSSCTVVTHNCQFVILSPTKKDQEILLTHFEKGIYSMILKLSEAVHSSLAEVLIFNCVSITFTVAIATV